MLINITIQTFTSQNELELSVSRWDEIKHEYMPKFYKLGLARYTTSRIWNKTEKHQRGPYLLSIKTKNPWKIVCQFGVQ